MCVDISIDMHVDTRTDVRIEFCVDMDVDSCMNVCIGMCIGTPRTACRYICPHARSRKMHHARSIPAPYDTRCICACTSAAGLRANGRAHVCRRIWTCDIPRSGIDEHVVLRRKRRYPVGMRRPVGSLRRPPATAASHRLDQSIQALLRLRERHNFKSGCCPVPLGRSADCCPASFLLVPGAPLHGLAFTLSMVMVHERLGTLLCCTP